MALDGSIIFARALSPKFRELAQEAGFIGHDAAQMARLLTAVMITEDPFSRCFSIVGFATRAGLVQESELTILKNPTGHDKEALAQMTTLWERAKSVYDGSLDGLVEIYIHYHGYLAATGSSGQLNDCLDLEPFVYFRPDDCNQKYVTGEDKWLKVARLVDESRAIDAKSFGSPVSNKSRLAPGAAG